MICFFLLVTKEVVSMGTGTKCIGQSKMRKSGKGGRESKQRVVWELWEPMSLSGERATKVDVTDFLFPTDCCSTWKPVLVHLKNGNPPLKQKPRGMC